MGMIDTIINPPNHASNLQYIAPNNANHILRPPYNANNNNNYQPNTNPPPYNYYYLPNDDYVPRNNYQPNANPPPYNYYYNYLSNDGYVPPRRQLRHRNVYNSIGEVNGSGMQTYGDDNNQTEKTRGFRIISIHKGCNSGYIKIANIDA
ncbi:unnamed protein product [Amaranthus hypochondriacus]